MRGLSSEISNVEVFYERVDHYRCGKQDLLGKAEFKTSLWDIAKNRNHIGADVGCPSSSRSKRLSRSTSNCGPFFDSDITARPPQSPLGCGIESLQYVQRDHCNSQ